MLQLHVPKIILNFKANVKFNNYIIFNMLLSFLLWKVKKVKISNNNFYKGINHRTKVDKSRTLKMTKKKLM